MIIYCHFSFFILFNSYKGNNTVMIKKIQFVSLLLCMSLQIHAQTIIKNETDTTIMTEYNDGKQWAYQRLGDFVVGMTNYEINDDYGKFYQIVIFIKYIGEEPVTFDPDYVSSYRQMPYTQVNTSYNQAAVSAANLAATNQMITLSKLMADDRNTKSKGYLKKTTIHPGEGIIGHLNIKRKKGVSMMVWIPVGKNRYTFNWDVSHKDLE